MRGFDDEVTGSGGEPVQELTANAIASVVKPVANRKM
jgi:hypothetical protein